MILCRHFILQDYVWGLQQLPRGMKEKEMKQIAAFINEGIEIIKTLHTGRIDQKNEASRTARKQFRENILKSKELASLRKRVKLFSLKFPVP